MREDKANLPALPGRSLTFETPHSEMTESEYASYLPSRGCPPSGAIPGPKLLYRLVKQRVLSEEEFKTTYEEGTFLAGDPCQRCSISTLSTLEAAKLYRRMIPNLADRLIANGVVPPAAGVHLNTPTRVSAEHWSWWPKVDTVRHSFFELIDEAA